MKYAKATKFATKSPFKLFGLFYYLKIIIFVIWILIVAMNVYGAYQDDKLPGTINYLGEKVATPTFELNNLSQSVIEDKGIVDDKDNLWDKIKDTSSIYWNLLFILINIFVWLGLIKFFVIAVLTGDTARVTSNWLITLMLFFLLQIIFIAYFHEVGVEGITLPFIAIKNFVTALPYLIPF